MSDELGSDQGGPANKPFSRRTLIRGGAIVGTTLWVAPVVETFAGSSKAWAADAGSVPNYCCSCWNPVAGQTGVLQNQGEADNHPPSVADCVAYCAGATAGQTTKYTSYTWCGPSAVPLTYSSGGLFGSGPGCYTSTAVATDCTTGTITYADGGYTYTQAPTNNGTH